MSLKGLDQAIVAATDWILVQQADDGHWDGNLSSDTTVTAWLAYGLYLWGDNAAQDALDWLCQTRNPDGGWGGAPGEPSYRDITYLVVSVLRMCDKLAHPMADSIGPRHLCGDEEVTGMARLIRAFSHDDPSLLSDHPPTMMRGLGHIGVFAPALLARFPALPRYLHEFILVSALAFARQHPGAWGTITARKASHRLSALWDRRGRWFMPGLSLAALAKYGEEFDSTVVHKAISWARKGQNPDGGWSWCPEGQFLDTALTVDCLGDLSSRPVQASISRAASWIRGRRAPEGGWGQHIAAPPDSDDTGAAILALMAAGADEHDTDVRAALDFLCRDQNHNGSWGYPHQVGANLSEDTAIATTALMASSKPRHRSAAQRGITWLLNHQQPNGAWTTRWYVQPQIACWRAVRALCAGGLKHGSGPLVGVRAYLERNWRDSQLTSAITTEQAAYTLLTVRELEDPHTDLSTAACQWLIDNQQEDGSWPLAVTGFMGDVEGAWRAGYTDRMWTHAHALRALVRYRNGLGNAFL